MRRGQRLWVAIGVLVQASAVVLGAEELKSFKVVKIDGQVEVKPVGASDFSPTQEGAVHEFGASVRTGRNSSVALELSPGNRFRLLAKTTIEVTPAPNVKMVRVALSNGQVKAELDDFPKDHKFQVETPFGVCAAVGTRFGMQYLTDLGGTNIKQLSVDCEQGTAVYTNTWTVLANSPPVTVDPGGRLQLTVQETGDVFSVTVSVGQATQINLGGSVVNMDAESVVELVVMKGPNGEPDFTKVAFHVAAGTVTVGGQQLNSQSGAGFVSENAFTPDPAAAELLRAHALPSGQQPTFVPPIIEDVPKSPAAQ